MMTKMINPFDEKLRDSQIEEIVNNFDWQRVHKVMTFLEWGWHSCGMRPPGVPHMKARVTLHLTGAWEDSRSRGGASIMICCGGFVARCNGGFLSLEFVLADWDGELAFPVEDYKC